MGKVRRKHGEKPTAQQVEDAYALEMSELVVGAFKEGQRVNAEAASALVAHAVSMLDQGREREARESLMGMLPAPHELSGEPEVQ